MTAHSSLDLSMTCSLTPKHQHRDMQNEKLRSIELANRVLEEELNQVKKQTQAEKVGLSELNLKLNDENKQLNSKLNELHSKYLDLNEHFDRCKMNDSAKLEQYEFIIKQLNADQDNLKYQLGKRRG